jgi:hypothetical protein
MDAVFKRVGIALAVEFLIFFLALEGVAVLIAVGKPSGLQHAEGGVAFLMVM